MANNSNVHDTLKALGIVLPPLATPAAAYVPFVRTGNLVFISGHIARRDGKPWVGQLGLNVDTATGKLAARAIAIELLGTLQAAVGDLQVGANGGWAPGPSRRPRALWGDGAMDIR